MNFDEETVLAALVFALIKLAGYIWLVSRLGRAYRPHKLASPVLVAIARIALGALVASLVAITVHVERSLQWYLLLVLARALEWLLVLWFFHERAAGALDRYRLLRHAALATLVSCLLDLPAGFTAILIPVVMYGIC